MEEWGAGGAVMAGTDRPMRTSGAAWKAQPMMEQIIMKPSMTSLVRRVGRGSGAGARRLHAACGRLESLEPRVHLAAYAGQSFADLFDLPGVLHEVTPPGEVEVVGFGVAAAALGDVDGDGKGDFAIAAPGLAGQGDAPTIAGRVFIYSGATGQLIRTLEDGFADFGVSLANVGDIDGDGRPDLLVGSPLADVGEGGGGAPVGAAYIYSGATGEVLRTYSFGGSGAEFGRAVALHWAGLAEGMTQILVGAPGAGPQGEGQVFVISTAEVLNPTPGAEIVFVLTGEGAGDRFGAALASVGDADGGDGAPEILVGAPLADGATEGSGRAYLFDGQTGALRTTLNGERPGDRFGAAVGGTRLGGEVVLLVGAPGWDLPLSMGEPGFASDVGIVRAFTSSGVSIGGRDEQGTAEGGRMGEAIQAIGDLNGDGEMDFAFVAPGAAGAMSRIVITHGPGGFVMATAAALPEGRRDMLFAAGDIDGDGVADVLAVGATGVTALSAHVVAPPADITGASEDLSFVFSSFHGVRLGVQQNYAIINGVFRYQSQIPGVGADAVIDAASGPGLIAGRTVVLDTEGTPTPRDPFIVRDGVRTLLADAVEQIIGDVTPQWTSMQAVRVTADGTILWNESDGTTIGGRAWMFRDGVLTLLWNGRVSDINAAGVIVGTRLEATAGMNSSVGVRRNVDGSVTVLNGLAGAGAINDAGAIAGTDLAGRLVVWREGEQVIPIDLPSPLLNPPPPGSFWVVDDIGPNLEVLARFDQFSGRNRVQTQYLWTPQDGIEEFQHVVFGPAAPGRGGLMFLSDGRIVTVAGVLEPVSESVVWSIAADSMLTTAASAEQTIVVGRNTLGDVILLHRGAGSDRWVGRRVAALAGEITDALAYTDPRTGQIYLFTIGQTGVSFGLVTAAGLWQGFVLENAAASGTITDHAAVFFTADRRGVLVGTDAAGDVIMYFQPPGVTNPSVWIPVNLTRTHIEARGQEFVPVASDMTGFATPWGTDHVAYLDAQGQVQILWWAPGETLWRIDQLTTVESSGALRGRPASFVTPWNTLHIHAFDEAGRTVAVWWAPGFGGEWRTDPLAPEDAPKLDPNSAAAFATPWYALNIFGVDAETGEVTVYWWTPLLGQWRVDRVIAAGAPEGFVATPPVAGTVSPAGEQNLFVRQEDGVLARLFWRAETGWLFESVTASAAG